MNKVFLLGRLVKDPEVKVTSNGKTFTRFTVAVNRRYVSGEKTGCRFYSLQSLEQNGRIRWKLV